MGRTAWLVLVCLALAAGGLCQEQGPAEQPAAAPVKVDQKDPAAVAKAYLEACQSKDIEGAVALLAGEPTMVERVRLMMRAMGSEREMGEVGLAGFLEELALLPAGLAKGDTNWTPPADAAGTTATVVGTQARPVTWKVELVKGADGLWRVDLAKTITSSTGHRQPFLLQMLMSEGGGGAPAQETDWQAQQRITQAARTVMEYADAHNGKLPSPQTWTDDVTAWSLDPSILRRPGLGEGACGYALNMLLAGQQMPEWPARQSTVLLFEVDDPTPNLVGDPEEDLVGKLENGKVPWVALCDGQAITTTPEMPLARLAEAWDQYETCQQHLNYLGRALLAYARDHDGRLPEETSWCDDIGPYLPAEAGPSVFTCPACPDWPCAYALNLALAGKDVRTLSNHGERVLLMHATRGVRNEAVDPAASSPVGRHRTRWERQGEVEVCAMLDRSIRTVPPGAAYPAPPAGGEVTAEEAQQD
jgi:hypothetical protein